ncbi:MAG: glycosyltransferase family 4 protein [Clostridia bacterium]|nr:glycosyltransferase family 4 protein [Clostridia bacterium]
MIKVLNITSDHNIGGAGRCILTFLEHYDREKFDIKVVLPEGSALIPYINATDTKCIETGGMTDQSYSKEAVKNLKRIFKEEKPDLIHAHACLSARIAAKMCKIPVVSTRHSVFPNKPSHTKGLGKLIAGTVNNLTSDRIIAVAQAAKDNLTEIGVKDKKIIVIKNGVKQVEKYSTGELVQAKNFYGLKDEFVFAMIARVEAIKGHMYFLEAAKIVLKKHENVKFMICGTGAYLEELQKKSDELGLNEKVLFTGYIKDVTSVMNVIDVNVNASYGTEATSLSLLEGMSLGKPIIASCYGGNPELVIDGVNGMLFETKNSSELAEKMLEIIENKELYDTLSKGAEKLYNEKYTARINAENIENVYLQTIGGRKNV